MQPEKKERIPFERKPRLPVFTKRVNIPKKKEDDSDDSEAAEEEASVPTSAEDEKHAKIKSLFINGGVKVTREIVKRSASVNDRPSMPSTSSSALPSTWTEELDPVFSVPKDMLQLLQI